MTRIHSIITGALLLAAFVAGPRGALAAGGVADHANIFKPQTITTANDIIQQIKTQEKHDVRVETFSAIPDDQKAQYSPDKKDEFFAQWAQKIGRDNSITGVVILICMDPSHLDVTVGNQTLQRAFTTRDRSNVRDQLVSAFKQKTYDAGILDALRTIDARMVQNIGQASTSSSSNNYPAQQPGNVPAAPRSSSGSHGLPIGGMVCLVIGAIVVIMLLAGLFNRNRGYSGGGGYNAPPPGGYPPGYMGGGYPQGGYQGGGGGGFGRGLLGGLLGGALGAWGYDRFSHPNQASGNQSGGYVPPPAGDQPGMNDRDTSYSGSGGDFGSSDSGGSSGGDFGGGGDSGGGGGGGGGDFGGGGDSGGGGGDSGGGSGGDF